MKFDNLSYQDSRIVEMMFNETLSYEGGYSDHKHDPGGKTNYGISQVYNKDVDVKRLTKDQAFNIYYERYFKRLFCPMFLIAGYPAISWLIFDCKFSGQVIPLYSLQRAINKIGNGVISVKVDGVPGPATLSAIQRLGVSERVLIEAVHETTEADAIRLAKNTMATQRRRGLQVKDYSRGFINRGHKRIRFAMGLLDG